jgi:hypothetical protein
MTPLSFILGIIGGPFGKIIGTVLGAGMLVGVGSLAIHHYESIISDRELLKVEVSERDAIIEHMKEGDAELQRNLEAAQIRNDELQAIQSEVDQIPSTDAVPADIRHTLERLRGGRP